MGSDGEAAGCMAGARRRRLRRRTCAT